MSKPHTNRVITSLSKTHFIKTKHIKRRRDFDELSVSPEHLEKCSYEVLMRHYRCINAISRSSDSKADRHCDN